MKSTRSYASDEEFVKAYYDQIQDIVASSDVLVEAGCYLSSRRGVVRFYWEVYRLNRLPDKPTALCRYDAEYPNPTVGSLSAFLFASSTKLAHMFDNCVAEAEKAARSKEA